MRLPQGIRRPGARGFSAVEEQGEAKQKPDRAAIDEGAAAADGPVGWWQGGGEGLRVEQFGKPGSERFGRLAEGLPAGQVDVEESLVATRVAPRQEGLNGSSGLAEQRRQLVGQAPASFRVGRQRANENEFVSSGIAARRGQRARSIAFSMRRSR